MSEQSPELRQAVERVKYAMDAYADKYTERPYEETPVRRKKAHAALAAAVRLATAEGAMAQWSAIEAPNMAKAEFAAARAACEAL